MTNKHKTILLSSIIAIAVLTVGLSTALAITPLAKTTISITDNEYNRLQFQLDEQVPINGEVFGGYAIITSDDVVAVTSHGGFYDSVIQNPPTDDPAVSDPFDGVAQVCTITDTGCGPEWHGHLVKPTPDARCVTGLAVGDLSFEEPSEKTKLAVKWISLYGIPLGDQTLTSAATGNQTTFTAGFPADNPFAVGNQLGVAFDLTPIVGEGGLEAICIGGLTEEPLA